MHIINAIRLMSSRLFSTIASYTASIFSLPSTGVSNGQFSGGLTIQGNSWTNREVDGDCENVSKWSGSYGSALALDSTKKLYGSNSIKVTSNGSATAFGMKKSVFTPTENGYWLLGFNVYIPSTNSALPTSVGFEIGASGFSGAVTDFSITTNTWITVLSKVNVTDYTQINNMSMTISKATNWQNTDIINIDAIFSYKLADVNEFNLSMAILRQKYYYITGVKSTFKDGGRISITNGDNICPTAIASWEQGTLSAVDGTTSASTIRIRTIDYITVLPLTRYLINFVAGYQVVVITYTSANVMVVNSSFQEEGYAFTTGSNVTKVKLLFKIDAGTDILATAITTIAPKLLKFESQAYYPASTNGYTRIGGSYDEISDGGNRVQRNQVKVLQASDITFIYTGYTNIDYVNIPKPTDYIGYSNNTYINNATLNGNCPVSDSDSATKIGTFAPNINTTQFGFGVTKGTTLADAKILLTGATLNYQLATPVVSSVNVRKFKNGILSGALECFGNNTTVIQESCAVKEAIPDVSNQITLPITSTLLSLVTCYRIDSPTWVDCLANATLNTGTGVITIVGADQTKTYFVVALTDPSSSTLATINESHPI